MKTTASKLTVQAAIDQVNSDHGYQLRIKEDRQEPRSKWQYHFTITSPSKIPGAKLSHSGRNIAAASWHAHGYLFDEILCIDPGAVIQTFNGAIDSEGGNWIDFNVGSLYAPMMASEGSIE
jgi:hypothetical protein